MAAVFGYGQNEHLEASESGCKAGHMVVFEGHNGCGASGLIIFVFVRQELC